MFIYNIFTRIAGKIRLYIYNFFIPNVRIGKNTFIESGVTLRSQYGGEMTIGDYCYISRGVQILTHGGDIIIGNNSTVNPYTVIYGQGGIKIGNGVRIATHCTIVPSNHIFDDLNEYIYKQGLSKKRNSNRR